MAAATPAQAGPASPIIVDRPTPSDGPAAAPVSAAEFAGMMRAVGPFEPGPEIAVAVSGGADSLALALLADGWVRRRGGTLRAITVDHGLRAASAAEARQVGAWLAGRGVGHTVLRWTGDKPAAGLPAAAREARYRLLRKWCADRGILHLLIAHQLEDQAETHLMRRARGSGPAGLAAMPAVAEWPELRLIRPLLSVPRVRLQATLVKRRQPWIEDPTNRDPAYTRVRIRARLTGPRARAAAAAADAMAETRSALERAAAAVLARSVAIFPEGYAAVDPRPLAAVPDGVGRTALAAVLRCIGGSDYGPRGDRLDRLWDALCSGRLDRPRTLAGCLIRPRADRLFVFREPAAICAETTVAPGSDILWDGRFRIRIGRNGMAPVRIGPLGEIGLRRALRDAPAAVGSAVPRDAAVALPAVLGRNGTPASPFFPWTIRKSPRAPRIAAAFQPANRLTKSTFSVV